MANALQDHYAEILLDRIRSETYPSGTYMDMFESFASPRMKLELLLHLMERIQMDTYPSIPMMQRVQRLAAEFGR